MDDARLPKRFLYGELRLGKRPQHRPKKRFKDNIKANMKNIKIYVKTWEELADDRPMWRKSVQLSKAGLVSHERSHLNVEHTCATCGKICK